MDEFFASADTSAAGRGDGKVSKLELRNAVRIAPRCPHQSLCARIITLYIARTHAQVEDAEETLRAAKKKGTANGAAKGANAAAVAKLQVRV